jgi:O-methyltransferase
VAVWLAKLPNLIAATLLKSAVGAAGPGVWSPSEASWPESETRCISATTFKGVVKAGEFDTHYLGGEHADTSPEIVRELVQRLGLTNVQVLAGVFPEEAGRLVEERKFRFCHIDVDVYRSAADVVEWIWSRLVPGGLIVFDDYGFKGCEGVTRFVNEQRLKPDRFVFHNLNGHAVAIKLDIHT